MKNSYIFCVLFFLQFISIAQVGINTTNPSSASVLDINSSTDNINFGGLMPPVILSLADRNAISPGISDIGLLIFLSDAGNSNFCFQIWNGAFWEEDSTRMINSKAKKVVRSIYHEAARAADSTERKKISKHAERSESEARIKAMLNLAQAEPEIRSLKRPLVNSRNWRLNCALMAMILKLSRISSTRFCSACSPKMREFCEVSFLRKSLRPASNIPISLIRLSKGCFRLWPRVAHSERR